MRNPFRVLAERFRGWSNAQRGLAILLAAMLCVLVLSGRRAAQMQLAVKPAPAGTAEQNIAAYLETDELGVRNEEFKDLTRGAALAKPPAASGALQAPGAVAPSAPAEALIAHTAELAVATKDFSRSRETMEGILEKHRGYTARLRMVGQKSGSVLSATLRVPSTELGPTVSDLKALGEVEREEQAADEVTQQHADLEARLANARKTLHRLQDLLQQQTYPDGNVRELQRQIANASAEVARLEAERQNAEQCVVFANVFFTLREAVAAPSETFGAPLQSALASGFGEAMASVAALLVFVIGRGPVVLLWCAMLYLPVRWVWRRLAAQPAAA